MKVSQERVKRWGLMGSWSILDQVLFSGANFITNVLLARWLTREAYGSYSISFSILLFLYQIYFSFILDPMSAIGPAKHSNQLKNYLLNQFRVHFVILIPISILGLIFFFWIRVFYSAPNEILSNLVIMFSLLPFLLVPWILRRILYTLQMPSVAALSSGLYAVFSLGLIFFFQRYIVFNARAAVISMGLAGIVVIGVLFYFVKRGTKILKFPIKDILYENWNFGRWLIASSLFVTIAGQAQVIIAGSVLGVESAGIVRALQNFAQPMILIVTAFGNLAVPALSVDFGRGQFDTFRTKVSIISIATTLMAGLYLLVLFIFRRPLEMLLYGGLYSNYSDMIPVWGVIPLLLAINVAPASALQSFQRPHALLLVSIGWAIVSITSAFVFTHLWGIWGVVVSALLGYLFAITTFAILYRVWVVKEILLIESRQDS